MDNLIDFDTSPLQINENREKSTLNKFQSFSDKLKECDVEKGLFNSDEFEKLLTFPIETQLIESSQSRLIATERLYLNSNYGANDLKTSENKFKIVWNSKSENSSKSKVKFFDEESKDSNPISLNKTYDNQQKQVKQSLNFEDKCEDALLIDFEEKTSPPKDYQKDTNSSALNIEKNSPRSKINKGDMKNRLLKLSISNALIQSPVSRRNSLEDKTSSERLIFNEAAKIAKQLSQTSLSTLDSSPKERSDDSCEDLMQINPKWVDSMSESDISKDLELLKIPMLDKISEDLKKKELSAAAELSFMKPDAEKFGISVLKEKLKNKENKKSAENVDQLIFNLKNYVINSETDLEKKNEAQKLLDSLSCLLKNENGLGKSEIIEVTETKNLDNSRPVNAFVRQATFNYDRESNICETKKNGEREVLDIEIQTEEQEDKCVQSETPNEINYMVKQISRMLEQNQNDSIEQVELKSSLSSMTSKPTIIVMMPSPNQKEFRRRSCSLTLIDNKNLRLLKSNSHSKENINHSRDHNFFKTPTRSYLSRRNSVSSVTPHSDMKNLRLRRSIYENINTNIEKSNENANVFDNIPITSKINSTGASKNTGTKYISSRSEFNAKNLRLKSSENIPVKGPIKATFQINTVKSSTKVLHSTPIQNSNIRRKSVFGTNSFSLNTGNCIIKNPPIACSTPMNGSPTSSPVNKKVNAQRLSVTPNSKTQSNSLNVSGNFPRNRRNSFSGSSKLTGKSRSIVQTSPGSKVSMEAPKIINRLKKPSTPTRFAALKKENVEPKK
ncbi:uncharacterized protein LOC129618908 [Condylostylus longicornis]|uniref:uncharacterized protein LOC129618908 n=1 Tax=Condylostylus longicornis TaxID=2530218 RepID=UPI00244E1647|nr:uncharacterized protein LOC129618908 [Condylostylus longicornis]